MWDMDIFLWKKGMINLMTLIVSKVWRSDGAWAEELDKAWKAAYDQARAANAHARAYDQALAYARIRSYVSLAVKASGLVALLLSTVILLGGYVQSLGKTDFFCIMAITVIQAAGIFQDWETNLQYLYDFVETSMALLINYALTRRDVFANTTSLILLSFLALVLCVLFYFVGPLALAAISSWRMARLNHGNYRDGTDSMADMMATLNIFYSLIIFQGTMFLVLLLPMNIYKATVTRKLYALEQLSDKWGKKAIRRYISDISTKCRKDPLSIKGRDLIKYAAELLDSDSQEDYLYGARLLSAFVNKGEDVSWLLLPSRHRIQRLLDSLMISCSLDEACVPLISRFRRGRCLAMIGNLDDKKEIREVAATIMANVAAHIDDLSKYPGAMRCISSLLQDQEETTQTYRNRNSKQLPDDPPPYQRPIGPLTKRQHYIGERLLKVIGEEEEWRRNLRKDQKRMAIREHRHRSKREGGTNNKLVQQGLTILDRLASNSDDNRRIICSTAGLLPKITAPVYSATLIEDIEAKAWADIVSRCIKVLYQLIRAPAGWTSRRLRHEISSDDQALSNLKSILLDQGRNEAEHQELKLRAMEILTELALDLSINHTKETKKVLVTKQLQLFLLGNGDDEEESAAIARRAMVSLSTNSESNSALIMSAQNDITGRRLTEILDEADHQQQQLVTMGILTELSLDLSVSLTGEMKKVLIKKQLQLFLLGNGDDEEDSATIAGRAMVSLSTNSESNSALIMTTETGIIGNLTGILDNIFITRRTIAAEMMANLCAHCNVDNNTMKEILLPKVLREIMSIKIELKSQERIFSEGQNNSAPGDEENQGNSASTNNEEKHSVSRALRLLMSRLAALLRQSPTGTEEISDEEREEQEAFLSLAQVIFDKLNSADLDGAIQNGIQNAHNPGSEEQRREAFVDKLKAIIDGNCNPTADCLRIVKLCSRIAESTMRCQQYVQIFRNKGFKSSLSKASETMSKLESCMLFVGTDFGLKKTVRPLFSEIEKSFGQI